MKVVIVKFVKVIIIGSVLNAGGASTKFLKVKVERESCEVEIIIIGPAVSFPLLVGRVQRSYTRIQNQLKLKQLKPWITILKTHNHDMNCNDFSFSCCFMVCCVPVCLFPLRPM